MLLNTRLEHPETDKVVWGARRVRAPRLLDKKDGLIPEGLDGKPVLRLYATANLDDKPIRKGVGPPIKIRRNLDGLARNWVPTDSPD